MESILFPLKTISPFFSKFLLFNRLIIEKAVIDFPLPDSPTTPKISLFFKLKEIFFKMFEFEIEILKLFTERRILDFNFMH